MRVYKFGGASVRSAEGVRNLCDIAGSCDGELLIIVSAMGKTTNALEVVVDGFMSDDKAKAFEALTVSENYHREIIAGLWGNDGRLESVEQHFSNLRSVLTAETAQESDYNKWYDYIVSHGEIVSTTIIAEYIASTGADCRWIDMRRCFVTDHRFRDANINLEASRQLLNDAISGAKISIGQGFIGATPDGEPTTLGREGSDYSAAVAAHLLDAESVSIWKDVPGILNADPRIFPDAIYIPELTYLDAIELAYSGAQIIHPKTIKPLQNKNIPLYVRPFSDKTQPGSVIKGEIDHQVDVPILIVKHNQIMMSVRPKDFSFVLQERLLDVLHLLEEYGVRPNLIQSSAVNLTLSVDNVRQIAKIIDALGNEGFRVVYNDGMELLTIRGYTPEMYEQYNSQGEILLTQKTRRMVRFLRRVNAK